MKHVGLVFAAALLVALEIPLPLPAQQRDMHEFLGLGRPPDAQAAKVGAPLYAQHCAGCHGENARGAQGPNLVRSPLVLHDEKGNDIGQIVRDGRPAGGMPAFPDLKQDQIYGIAEFIHLQVEQAANRGVYGTVYANQRSRTTGDRAKGKQFFDAHCAGCHSASGNLSKIGVKFPEAASLQSRFLWPSSNEPPNGTVKTAAGETIKGSLVKVNDFDVRLRDSKGEIHNWSRDRVTLQIDDKLAGHRALLPSYTDADLHNITAYLLELK